MPTDTERLDVVESILKQHGSISIQKNILAASDEFSLRDMIDFEIENKDKPRIQIKCGSCGTTNNSIGDEMEECTRCCGVCFKPLKKEKDNASQPK